MITGSCLCGEVRFEFERTRGDFELCHCNRCRKSSGSAFLAMIGVDPEGFRFVSGVGSIRRYQAPILHAEPAYQTNFCGRCGSPVPNPDVPEAFFEVPAGLLDCDPGVTPDRHIFTHLLAPWWEIADDLPRPTLPELRDLRRADRENRD